MQNLKEHNILVWPIIRNTTTIRNSEGLALLGSLAKVLLIELQLTD